MKSERHTQCEQVLSLGSAGMAGQEGRKVAFHSRMWGLVVMRGCLSVSSACAASTRGSHQVPAMGLTERTDWHTCLQRLVLSVLLSAASGPAQGGGGGDTKGYKPMALSLLDCLQLEFCKPAFSAQGRAGVQLGLTEGQLRGYGEGNMAAGRAYGAGSGGQL